MDDRGRKLSVWQRDIRYLTNKDELNIYDYPKPWFILSTDSTLMNWWSKFMTLLLLYTAIVTPYRVSFVEFDSFEWSLVEYLISGLFFVDFLLTCVTSYYDTDKNLISEPKKILYNYFTGWMIPDLVVCMPLNLILNQEKNYNSLVRVARLPRLYRLVKITKLLRIAKVFKNSSSIMKQINSVLKISIAFERIFWFLITYILLIHIEACLWVFVGKYDMSSFNWIYSGDFQDTPDFDLYVIALYWTIETVATVGYGDIVAVNSIEKIYSFCIMTIGIIFYSYCVSSLTNILSNIDTREAKLKQQMLILENLSKEYFITNCFQTQISKALEFISHKSHHGIDEFIKDLPGTLGNQVLIVIYEKIISDNVFFASKSTEFVAWVAPRLNFYRMGSYEIIYSEDEYASQMYFLTHGKAEFILMKNRDIIPFLEIEKGYYFGEIDLLFSENKSRMHTTRAGEICEMLTLGRENFYLLLNTYEEEAIEICTKARERFTRIEEIMGEAEQNYRNSIPVNKKKTIPVYEENYAIRILKRNFFTDHSSVSNEINKNQTLFKKIVDSKFKIKEVDQKIIRNKTLKLEIEVEGLKNTLFKLQDLVAEKYGNFCKKTPRLSPNSSYESK
jgi:Ion transport protein/Cyclic nucleotide-binding domain